MLSSIMRMIGSMDKLFSQMSLKALLRREREERNAALRERLHALRTPEQALLALRSLDGIGARTQVQPA